MPRLGEHRPATRLSTARSSSSVCPADTVIRAPTPETCNNADDNCNGVVDDGSPTTCATAINLGTISGTASNTSTLRPGPR
ncbi:MAG: hypothetical protein R3A52_22660 [Polyangiales bacterium]